MTRRGGARGGFSLMETLVAASLLALLAMPLLWMLRHDRSGAAALDKEIAATAAATAVLEYLRSLPYDAVPVSLEGQPVPDLDWGPDSLVMPQGWNGARHPFDGQFPAITGETFVRTLAVEQLGPWPGREVTLKQATVVVSWRQPSIGGEDRSGRVMLRTLLSASGELDEGSVPAR